MATEVEQATHFVNGPAQNLNSLLASRQPTEGAASASTKPKAATTKLATRWWGKHVKAAPKLKPEMDYFPEKRNLVSWFSRMAGLRLGFHIPYQVFIWS